MKYEPLPPAERIVLFELIVEGLRELLHPAEKVHLDASTILVLSALSVGQLRGHPFTCNKTATYTHVPRQTVQRKLDALCERKWVRKEGLRYHVVVSENPVACDFYRLQHKLVARIRRAVAEWDRLRVSTA